ncbi:hypothetical protein ACWEOI_32355 [Nocardia sp. NPDC004340]
MTASRYASNSDVAEPIEPSGWGRHLGVGDDIADSLGSGQLGALIFARKLVRCWYIANFLLASTVGSGVGLFAWEYGQRTYGDCTGTATCYPRWELLVLGVGSGLLAAGAIFLAASLPCFWVAYAIRWSARAMADRNGGPEHPEAEHYELAEHHQWRAAEQPTRRQSRTEEPPRRPARAEEPQRRQARPEPPQQRRPAHGEQAARRPART